MSENWDYDESQQIQSRDNFQKSNDGSKFVYNQSFSRAGKGTRKDNSKQNYGSNERPYQRNDDYRRNDKNIFVKRCEGNRMQNGEKTIDVITNKVGLIVGRGGSKIRQLEQDSGARIHINREKTGDHTKVKITGSVNQIENACQLINNIVNDSSGDYQQRNFNSHARSNNRVDRNYNDNTTNQQRDNQRSDYSSNKDNNSSNSQYNSSTNNNNQSSSTATHSKVQNDDDFVPIDWDKVYAESDRKAAEYLASLPKIIKNFYVEDAEISNMSALEVSEFRLKNMHISVSRVFSESPETDKPISNPIKTFEHAFKPFPEILNTIRKQDFQVPSPIQCQAWPVILSGEDMIGVAQTGTGKTLAFLLPAMIHIENQTTPRSKRVGPTVLILSPTRELALQIEKEINKYSYRDIKCICIYGGGNRKDQISWLRETRPEIVVATPGRLDDLVCSGEIDLESVTYLVLDEADKMLEMGFECQIRKILIRVRTDRQSIMTSATWPPLVRRLASQYSKNPVQVVVGSLDLTAVHSVSQRIEIIDEDDKRMRLNEFLSEMEPEDKVIVFCGKKCVTDDITSDLIIEGIKCQSIHGNREQCDREQALDDLKSGEVHILIATDVAARGIDIADITHIFNYDFPKNIEEYVHRIGRTGRAGRSGHSISLFTRNDWSNAADLIKILEEANQEIPQELRNMAQRYEAAKKRKDGFPRRGRGGRGIVGYTRY